mgnify:CR=1 FL=1
MIGEDASRQLHNTRDRINEVAEHNGGKINIKKIGRKIKHTVQRATKVYDNNKDLINHMVDDDTAKALSDARGIAGVNGLSHGGKFKARRFIRKAGHTVERAKKISHKVAAAAIPATAILAPEFLPLATSAYRATGSGFVPGPKVGGSVAHTKGVMIGGSFRGPESRGRGMSHRTLGGEIKNNYSPFVDNTPRRGPPPSLKNRSLSVA